MKHFKKYLMLLALVIALPATAQAAGKSAYTQCGIGAMLFENDATLAVVSNVIWDSGTTALTSAAASEDTCKGSAASAALYIHETYSNLEEETAKGEGQHVVAVLNIMGCESQSHANIIGSIRNEFAKSVSDASFAEKSTSMKAKVYSDIVQNKVTTQYAAQCQVI
ncbi:MAG: DUF3015 domain-containing protein [Gammaproteobacteria bacterium]|nr:DUF3015 domain-containing protein [Gammaproteobacteria bacterium]